MKIIDFLNYDKDFTWDYKLHFPIPTLDYIKRRTGQDLLGDFDNESEAIGAVISLVRSAKNFLFHKRLDMKAWEYYLARDVDMIYEMLEYLLEVITFAFVMGNYDELYKVLNGQAKSVALENAKRSILGFTKTLPHGANIREGY